ncbi:MAG: DEAD/DEAH box helicase family protein [Lachnospiraceae bacterium]|nr:DEAD/DEAH box helicase family protein [Lachnospiraceae bacterium]
MDEQYIVSKINEYLHVATGLLVKWLEKRLSRVSDDWWNDCVIDQLSYQQRTVALKKGIKELSDLDLAAVLRVADKNWYEMRNYSYLPTRERECIREMQVVRNNWAHCAGTLPQKDDIIHDIEIIITFYEQMEASREEIGNVEKFLNNIKNDVIPERITNIPTNANIISVIDGSNNTNCIEIKEKDTVYLVGEPETRGMVFSVQNVGDTIKYEVFVGGGLKTFYDGQIALEETKSSYNWTNIDTFKSYLTAYEINNPSVGNLYSLNSAKIDFVPYQFRPALKMIKADEPRILIADSVGVGKTIEAGLIIKELEARNELDNVVVICPKPLVSERKWEEEMKKFDEEFVPLSGGELRQIISDTHRDESWPARYNKVIIPYSILDSRVYEGTGKKRGSSFGLIDLDPAPHFDLVIIDEAHHIRNGSLEKEKAFAYKCTKYFCDHADAVVMLTATPLQTGDDDLFTLLNVLRPDVILDRDTFEIMSQPNKYISETSHIVRAANEKWNKKAYEKLSQVITTNWGKNVIEKNPLYKNTLQTLLKDSITREERVQLITDIESLHSFDGMLNRTRRKDIQDFCIRHTYTRETIFTSDQKKLYDELLSFEFEALATIHNVKRIPFMMSTIKRQAASCIYGLAPHLNDIVECRFAKLMEDSVVDEYDYNIDKSAMMILKRLAKRLFEIADNLPDEDPKFNQLMEIIEKKQEEENNKIILFSTFRHTLSYIRNKLKKTNYRIAQIDGSVKDEQRREYHDRFKLPKEDDDAIDILMFTEVGSEGLDYQFCNLMVNYDLPWNPMRIEQRIGRIDRRGQTSDIVSIYNLITKGTVDYDIYNRCLMRIGVFERSIGECEAILGEISNEIEKIVLDYRLSDDERRDKLEQMADNEVRRVQELNRLEEEEKGLFGFDLSNFTVTKEIQTAESPWLTPRSLQYLVERYLKDRLGNSTRIVGESNVKNLRLSASDRKLLRQDFAKLSKIKSSTKRNWEAYLKGSSPFHKITFDSEAAGENSGVFFITTVHPLVRQAAKYYATDNVSYINIKATSSAIKPGKYPFTVYAWSYIGINHRFKIVTVCNDDEVEKELVDILQIAGSISEPNDVSEEYWNGLEEKHINKWKEKREEHKQSVELSINYKLEGIKNNYLSRKRIIEKKINDVDDINITRMHKAELENMTEKYKSKVAEIEDYRNKVDIHTTLIAKGIVSIME